MRAMSTAALPMRSMAEITCSTLDISSASRGERAASTHTARIVVHEVVEALLELVRPRRPCRESPKNRAAYARSTMSSEVSFASESMALRFRGWSSCPTGGFRG